MPKVTLTGYNEILKIDMEIILKIIATPIVLLLASKFMSTINIRDKKAAIYTALSIMIMGFIIGWLITLIFNVLTLGLFWLIGLGIVTRTIAYAVVIEIVDKFRGDFETKGFGSSVILSIWLAVAWGIVEIIT
ncbi:phage holin family protein [Cryomorpha ignava]|uniref:Phage holin family protein n=2 Tax=Cryomorpha ignava TaxID=101383 RepID=A0A7K3WNR3_9FLAO|nr:phage holin family protein [Cryomorpha ignava]